MHSPFKVGVIVVSFSLAIATCAAPARRAGSPGEAARVPPGRSDPRATVEIEPAALILNVGETAQLRAVVRDAAGKVVPGAQIVFFGKREFLSVTPSGRVTAHRPGVHKVTALSPEISFAGNPDSWIGDYTGIRAKIAVTVPLPPVTRLDFVGLPSAIHVGVPVSLELIGTDASGARRGDIRPRITVADRTLATTDGFSELVGLRPGKVTVTASLSDAHIEAQLDIRENPVHTLGLGVSRQEARTGDVLHFTATARDGQGQPVVGVPIRFSLEGRPDPNVAESLGAGAPAQVAPDGRFVAEQPGIYTVIASVGDRAARRSVRIVKRDVARKIEFVGQAPVRDHVTTDFWVWQGPDGRDYAALGTWSLDGSTAFYDVTNPADMKFINKVTVDARTINSVKVSDDGRICVISREGASNRKNGVVILDVANPRDVKILGQYADRISGGVHNAFLFENHVYAINARRRFDIISIVDPTRPEHVSFFEAEDPGRSVHDVWVKGGIAYQAGISQGLMVVDVGGGGRGGSLQHPVEMARAPQINGLGHAVWPFRSKSAGKHYVIGGDEGFFVDPRHPTLGGINFKGGVPSRAAGWVHIVDIDDPKNPREVARYQIADQGPHNMWVDWEAEILYIAHYDSGLRVVDLSGELMGDLYRQGREIAKFYSDDPKGFVANAPFAHSVKPHKGHIFFSDMHSGLWAVKMLPRADDKAPVNTP